MTVDDVGPDVEQLEQGLVALGYDSEGLLTVDETYTDYTATVVERWQEDQGLEVTGRVTLGSVVFVPKGARVASIEAVVGDELTTAANGSAPVLTVSSAERQLTFTVESQDLATIDVGTEVAGRLPDRSTIAATVTALAVAEDGAWFAQASIDDEAPLPEGDAIPVDISWTSTLAENAVTVRANAVTRLDNGTYAIEVVDKDGGTSFVPVEIGVRSGSIVEISGDIEPGTEIISP